MHCLVLYVLHLDLCSLMYKAEWNVRILFLLNQDVTQSVLQWSRPCATV
jgi:hypothetical protein